MNTERTLFDRIITSSAPRSVILVRLVVGGVFLSEGVQKFLFPDALGVGRFVKIGIPAPEIMAPFVGVFEIGCGVLLLAGLRWTNWFGVRCELTPDLQRRLWWRGGLPRSFLAASDEESLLWRNQYVTTFL